MIALLIMFVFSLFAIGALFAVKEWEEKSGRVLAPELRTSLDNRALHLKELFRAGERDLEKLPPAIVHFARVWLHSAAVGFGHLAHWLGERSHALADMVSYKHRFEKRELRSEFLKKVIEHKNDNGSDTLDTTS